MINPSLRTCLKARTKFLTCPLGSPVIHRAPSFERVTANTLQLKHLIHIHPIHCPYLTPVTYSPDTWRIFNVQHCQILNCNLACNQTSQTSMTHTTFFWNIFVIFVLDIFRSVEDISSTRPERLVDKFLRTFILTTPSSFFLLLPPSSSFFLPLPPSSSLPSLQSLLSAVALPLLSTILFTVFFRHCLP